MAAAKTSDPAARFRRTRAAHRDETAEDYVEAIDALVGRSGEARVRDLAQLMGVSHVTVTRIVARLVDLELVRTQPYRPVELTAKGAAMAARVRRRHEIVLGFLLAIGVPERQAEIDAEGIEHHVSVATIRAMEQLVRSRSEAAP